VDLSRRFVSLKITADGHAVCSQETIFHPYALFLLR